MQFSIATKQQDCAVLVERGALKKAAEFLPEGSRAFIVTDSGVPSVWLNALREQLPGADVFIFPQGEASKNLAVYEELAACMLDCGISRNDCAVALGGGVAGDLAGFAAATYMRGIRYINVPTTTLSQVDSCIGGKTALDVAGVKNAVGAFHQPAAVIVDPDVLSTLPERQFNAGLAEAVKAGLIRDPELFEIFEKADIKDRIEEILYRSLKVKKDIVEADELELGERALLNFGHTFGHAYESYYGPDRYLHGECVAMGMIKVINDPALKERVRKILERLSLPTGCEADPDSIMDLLKNDKKADHGIIKLVVLDEPGKAYVKLTGPDELRGRLL